MPSRLCLEPGCPEYASFRGRCITHAASNDRAIKRMGRSIYNTKRWKLTRRRKLHLTPLCERCGAIATDVHHKHGVKTDPWSLGGLESLCHSCHSVETRQEQLSAV